MFIALLFISNMKLNMSPTGAQQQRNLGDLLIADCGTTHTILKSKKYFSKLNPTKGSIRTVGRREDDLIEGAGKAHFILPNGTHFLINNALFSPKSNRNLLGFGDVYLNGYDTLTKTIENEKYMLIIDGNRVLEKLPKFDSNLHYTYMNIVESNMVVKEKCCDPGILSLWHDRLGHPGLTMMRRIIENTHGHPLKDQKFPQGGNMKPCTSCSLGKLIIKPSPMKVDKESPRFLERIQGDICGPIHPPSGHSDTLWS